jgi:hypothetical protein
MEDEVEKVSLEMIKKGERWLEPPGIQGKKMAHTPLGCPKCVVWDVRLSLKTLMNPGDGVAATSKQSRAVL